jgi:hypothetical protein
MWPKHKKSQKKEGSSERMVFVLAEVPFSSDVRCIEKSATTFLNVKT